jgi:hypothetical protein
MLGRTVLIIEVQHVDRGTKLRYAVLSMTSLHSAELEHKPARDYI